jgi:predicted nucleic acid-binding protein
MILLDTNVVSAVMRPRPLQQVVDWLDGQATSDLFLSAVTTAEIGFGLHCLPPGKRRRALEERFQIFLERGFESRILAFDTAAAQAYAEIMGERRSLGRPMGNLDGQIAAIAQVHRFAVATGNVRDFEECGIEILNPF